MGASAALFTFAVAVSEGLKTHQEKCVINYGTGALGGLQLELTS
jgi:hypothetical protein